ncbi:uncharacterized protein [Scyliorhinus torazame]|uniref:uncharacterized protein isoform X1 n=2 Tax=Scyliorhinus torazame TaxID=75743 RepID=UPI003B59E24A
MDSQSEHREQELEVQRDSSSLCLSEHFGPIAMLQKPIFFVLLVVATQGVTAAESNIQEGNYPNIRVGNECRISTENISGCQDGWQEEKELSVNNTPFAILTQDNPLNCIYPCKNLTHQEIWLNCTLINDTLIKYTCTKDKKVYEFTHNFKGKDIQERLPSVPNLTTVTPESQTRKVKKPTHIGIIIAICIGIVVLIVLGVLLKMKCQKISEQNPAEQENFV